MTELKGTPLALPLTWEEHELSEGYSSIVYDGRGMAIDKHLSAAQAEAIARMVNAHGELLALAKLLAESLRYEIKRNERSGDDEGAKAETTTTFNDLGASIDVHHFFDRFWAGITETFGGVI